MDNRQKEIYKVFSPIYKAMSNHYRALFSPSDPKKAAEHCHWWIKEISSSDITAEEITNHSNSIMGNDNFIKNPPNPTQYISFLKMLRINKVNDQWDDILLPKFKNLKDRYRSNWDKSDILMSDFYFFFKDEVIKINPNIEIIESVFSDVTSAVEYITFPPSINEILFFLKVRSFDKSIPLTFTALRFFLNKQDNLHPLIKKARYSMGGLESKSLSMKHVEYEFKKHYSIILDDYINNKLVIQDEEQENPSKMHKENDLNIEELTKSLEEIINSI